MSNRFQISSFLVFVFVSSLAHAHVIETLRKEEDTFNFEFFTSLREKMIKQCASYTNKVECRASPNNCQWKDETCSFHQHRANLSEAFWPLVTAGTTAAGVGFAMIAMSNSLFSLQAFSGGLVVVLSGFLTAGVFDVCHQYAKLAEQD